MNTHFSTAHLKTLQELIDIAEKYNCYIKFGISSESGASILGELLEENGFDYALIDELENAVVLKEFTRG